MRWWPGRERVPAEVRDGLTLEAGERPLAFARTPDGPVVATDRALHLPGGHRLPWERVEFASWTEGVLRVAETGTGVAHRLPMDEPGGLPDAVHERVRSTIVISDHVPLLGPKGVRIVARRPHGGDEIAWTLVFDEGLDPADPGLRAEAEQALHNLRHQTGL